MIKHFISVLWISSNKLPPCFPKNWRYQRLRIIAEILDEFQPKFIWLYLESSAALHLFEVWNWGFSPWSRLLVWIMPKQPCHRLLLHVGPLPIPGENPDTSLFHPLQRVWCASTMTSFSTSSLTPQISTFGSIHSWNTRGCSENNPCPEN